MCVCVCGGGVVIHVRRHKKCVPWARILTMFPPCDISCRKAGLRCGAMPALVGSPRGRLGKGGGIPG